MLIANKTTAKISINKKFNPGFMILSPLIAYFKISAPYVKGRQYDKGLINLGKFGRGINKPHKKIMGNLKKLEKVWASKTSLTETAINKPKKVEVIEIKKILTIAGSQLISERSVKSTAKNRGTRALKTPKIMAPLVLANIKVFKSIGANKSRLKEACFFSKVIVTASIEVVPKRIDKDIKPGKKPGISTGASVLKKNIKVQEIGKSSPQLILGGFK